MEHFSKSLFQSENHDVFSKYCPKYFRIVESYECNCKINHENQSCKKCLRKDHEICARYCFTIESLHFFYLSLAVEAEQYVHDCYNFHLPHLILNCGEEACVFVSCLCNEYQSE